MAAPFYVSQRQIGTVNEIVPVYVQDLSVSTLTGLANVFASTVSATWFRSDATGASSFAIISTAAMGTYSSGNWVQINSSLAKGWYELGAPSAMFSSGRWAVLHVYGAATSTTTFSHAPLFYELTKTDNQTYVSSQTLSTAICRVYSSPLTTSAAGMMTVDVSTLFGRVFVTSAPGVQTVDVSSFYGSGAVTTAAGIISVGRVGVSSFGLAVGISSFNVGLQVGVSTFNSPVGVSSFNVGLQVGVSSFNSPVGVSSFNVPLQVGVSSFGIAVGVSSVQDKGGYGVSSVSDKTDYGVSSVTGLSVAFLDVSVSSRLSVLSYVVPDNTNIANIQAKTSSLTYTVGGKVDSNIKSVNDVTVTGAGTGASPWGP